ncbi:MAG: hypothetical protein IT447_00520 [Phycisphaerales bacterium]|jgi:hypothetical protein|nr:hypothetical protein [Phycisphaerales bacterium]
MDLQNDHPDPARWPAWTAGLVVGLLAAAVAYALADHAVNRLRRLRRDLDRGIPPGRWSHAILGSTMRAVSVAWGPPLITTAPQRDATAMTVPAYFTADTWYYPINPTRRLGMAIHFARGIARRVQVIRSPR